MGLVQLDDISLSFADRPLLQHITLSISSRDRIALTGVNGSGKSTLMKIIAGLQSPDSGNIVSKEGTRISYLPQSGIVHMGSTLTDELEEAFSYYKQLEEKKQQVEQDIADHTKDRSHLLEDQHTLQETLITSGYYERKSKKEMICMGLGFRAEDMDRPCSEFSGGWQMRIALAKILLEQPDILLLDEPTNYLDLEARNWLEQFLDSYRGGVLLVSHDRFFLDSVVSMVMELFLGRIKRYRGNYSEYEKKRRMELAQLEQAYEQQQQEIAKTEEFIRKFRYNASKAKQVQSRIKYLEKLERIELPENMKSIHFSFPQPPHSGHRVLTVEDLSKSYGDATVLDGLRFTIEKGERIVVTGVNGAGKSTLLRILAGIDTEYSGEIKYGTGVTPGYFAQDHEMFLSSENSIYEEVEQEAPTELIPGLRGLLGAFLFRGDDIYKKTHVLSGGEKSRLSLIKLLLHPVNFLILDEPTNHLDIHSKDILLESLQQFSGTLIFVSHDRYFIEHLADRVIELEHGRAALYPGDYSYYLWKKETETHRSEEQNGRELREEVQDDLNPNKIKHSVDKRQRNKLQNLQKREGELLSEMEQLEEEIHKLHRSLEDPAVYSDRDKAGEKQKAIEEKHRLQEKLSREWEEIDMALASFQGGEQS